MSAVIKSFGLLSQCRAAVSNLSTQHADPLCSALAQRSKAHAALESTACLIQELESKPSQSSRVATRLDHATFLGLEQPKGLLVDAAGTLIMPTEPVSDVYLRYGRRFGVTMSGAEVLNNFRVAYNAPWTDASIRYQGDGREFWRRVVAESVGCENEELFEEIYQYYERPEAWALAPGSFEALTRLHEHGIKIAVVSNFDTRLRPILKGLKVSHLFDAICVSAEVGAEKPNPCIFECALQKLKLSPSEVVHIGDDRRNDVWGARDVGILAWLWNIDVANFEEVAERVLTGHCYV